MTIFILCLCAIFVYWLQDHIYTKNWNRELNAGIAFQKEPVFEGEDAFLTETVSNAKWLPIVILHLKFETDRKLEYHAEEHASVSDKSYKHDIFTMMPYQQVTRTLRIHCKGRGFYQISRFDLSCSNLFMGNHYIQVFEQYTDLYVFPKQIPADELELPFRSLLGTIITKRMTNEDPFEFRGLRDYQPYDSLRSINWKATAKSGKPMVNVFDYTAGQELRIILNLEDETHWREYLLLEQGIRLASSLSARFLAEQIPVSLLTNGRDIIFAEPKQLPAGSSIEHLLSINELLARIDLEQPMYPITDLIQSEITAEGKSERAITYLLIGYPQREDLYEAFAALTARHPGSMWLLPLLPEMELHMNGNHNFEMVRWEVRRADQ